MTRPGASTPLDANTDRSQPCGASAAGKAPVSRREPPAAAPRAFGALLAAHLPLRRILFALGLGFFVAGLLLPLEGYRELLVFATAYLLWGGDVLLRAARNITRGRVFDENFLMSIATLGAFAIGEYPEGVAVMIFYQVGEMLQGHAVNRSRRSIRELMDIRPDYAHLQEPGGTRTVAPEAVQVGDVIVVRPGEKVPLDGEVRAGTSSLDLSALTGESLPQEVQPGDAVLSGAVNSTGLLHLEVTRAYRDSTVSRILALVEGAEARKAKTERFITRFARYYTPGVVAGAALLALLPPLLLPGEDFATWVYRALVFLVISCPCALLISIPLGFFGGIGGASRRGILVKGGNVLEGLSRIDTVIFDKTGTLTEGVFQVREILPWDGLKQAELLAYGAAAARHSSHPVSASLLRAWEALREPGAAVSAGEVAGFAQLDGSTGFTGPHEPGEPDEPHGPDQPHGPGEPGGLHRPAGSLEETGRFADRFQEMPGRGVLLETPRGKVLMGSARFLEEEGLTLPPGAEAANGGQTRVHLALNGQYAGQITFSDRVRPDAANAVARLRQLGVRQVLMLTGDKQAAAEETARLVGVDQVRAELLPHEKIAILEELEEGLNSSGRGDEQRCRTGHGFRAWGKGGKPRGRIAFVGDGINDAPALARADIGVAIGGVGSDAALEAADVVLMTGEPSKLVEAITIARKTGRIVRQNVVFALGTKALILLLGVAGIATMWGAVFADVGVALLAVLNAMRAMR